MIRPILVTKTEHAARDLSSLLGEHGVVAATSKESDKVQTLFTVSVDEPEHGKALTLVRDSVLSGSVIPCPECDSIAVEFPSRARASGIANAVETVLAAVVPPKEHWFQCCQCGHKW